MAILKPSRSPSARPAAVWIALAVLLVPARRDAAIAPSLALPARW